MSLEDVIKEYGLFHMYFQTRPCQIAGTMLGDCKRAYETKLCSETFLGVIYDGFLLDPRPKFVSIMD
jgi:hypothetical protein